MTVIRLADGDLLLHSPTPFDAALQQEIGKLGRIRHLVAPNVAHWRWLGDWQRTCSGTTTWAAPHLRSRSQVRRSQVRLDMDLGAAPPAAWAADLDQIIVPGGVGFTEVAFFHRPSRTLVLADLVQNLDAAKLPAAVRPFARLAGVVAPVGKAPVYLRLIVRMNRPAAMAAARQLVALAPDKVIFAHGAWFERDATAALRRSLAWLLA
jgi:hypothetical protein